LDLGLVGYPRDGRGACGESHSVLGECMSVRIVSDAGLDIRLSLLS
jgi:hypothetical protein